MPAMPDSRFTSMPDPDAEFSYFGAVSQTGLIGRDEAPCRQHGEISDVEPDDDYDD